MPVAGKGNIVRWQRKPVAQIATRQWFRDEDGIYYRNCPLIAEEWDEAIEAGDMAAVYRLRLEWGRAWHNTITKTELEEGDIIVKSKDDPIIEPYLSH